MCRPPLKIGGSRMDDMVKGPNMARGGVNSLFKKFYKNTRASG